MSDMEISVRLRRESGADMIIYTFCQILVDLLLDKNSLKQLRFPLYPPLITQKLHGDYLTIKYK